MENFPSHNILLPLSLFLPLLFQFSFLPLLSSAYTLPAQYFINCGSDSNATINRRNFIGDVNPDSFTFSTSQSNPIKTTSPLKDSSPLYQTARIFTHQFWYDLKIVQNGTYIVRFHFYPFPSPKNLSDSQFSVSASGFYLLSNFTLRNNTNSPVIKEFLLTIVAGNFRIFFTPSQESSSAFVNAIEAFLAPENFIPDSATHVTPAGPKSNFKSLLSNVLNVVHRINVGGVTLTPENDTLWRNWVPDDDYLYFRSAARNTETNSQRPKYQDGGATEYTAPDFVYTTAKQLNIDIKRQLNFFNITWQFDVSKNAKYFVRAHFCDIVSEALSFGKFNFYIYSMFSETIYPYEFYPQLGAPFYYDFVVESDSSGFMNISIGPRRDSANQTAFLNGLEIMEILEDLYSGGPEKCGGTKKNLYVIIGCVVGGLVLFFILVVLFLFGLKCRKAKAVETLDWPLVPLYGGNSYSMSTERTANASRMPNLNLGLKVTFSEILYATNNFDAKLMIGKGGFGKVYKGILRSGVKVAVKRSDPGHGQGLPEFQTEITVLSQIRHRHLVSLIGYCNERSEMILVYEFMEKGTLREHLYISNGDCNRPYSWSELSWNRRLEICIGAAKGLHYLHTGSNMGIIHRDVKSTNILLDENYVAKVADFGLSRSGPLDQTHISTEVKGSFGYLDPEYFKYLQLTQKSDVYSFGVVLLEVLCARPAINSLLPPDEVNLADWGISWQKKGQLEKIIDPLLAGKINPNSLRKFGETVEKCLKEHGVERPGIIDVLWDLEYALQLQNTTMPREPHEDSTTDTSWKLPMPAVHRLPSHHSIPSDEDEMPMGIKNTSDTSYSNASEVFSQLRIDEAR